jgi:transposase-like protein
VARLTAIANFSDGRTHKCGTCRRRFSIRVRTIFEDSKIPLRTWLLAVWMITSHKKGIASTQLAKDLGITQKSAWFVLHRLRYAIRTGSFNRPLDGTVEADELHLGGKAKNVHRSKRVPGGPAKMKVSGLLERGGELRTATVPDLTRQTLNKVVADNVAKGARLMTDFHGGYDGLWRHVERQKVNHQIGEYVRGDAHTNSIESVWALFRRQVIGTHHWLSPKHVSRYLNEMTWRFNLRSLDEGDRVNFLLAQTSGRLTYKALIA